MTIAVRTYDEEGSSTLKDPADISEVVGHRGCLLWVDLLDPGEEDFKVLAEEFELHPLAIEDAKKHGQRPKLEHYPTHAFLVAYSGALAEVDLFIGPNWLVSVRERNEQGEHCPLTSIRARFERTRPAHTTVGFLVYTVLDELVDEYFVKADALEDLLEDLEERILDPDARGDERIQGELLELRRKMVEYRRAIVPLRDVVQALLRGDVEQVDEAARVHLQDVHDHVLRVVDQLDSERELVGNAVDAHLAIMSNRMNRVMKRMTSWGALLLGSTLIAGIYGMNFDTMPELEWLLGYPWALGLMVVTTLVGYTWFKRRDWL